MTDNNYRLTEIINECELLIYKAVPTKITCTEYKRFKQMPSTLTIHEDVGNPYYERNEMLLI